MPWEQPSANACVDELNNAHRRSERRRRRARPKELDRQLGITYKTIGRMGHKIREHMAAADGEDQLSGDIEIDEAFFSGVMPAHKGQATGQKKHHHGHG